MHRGERQFGPWQQCPVEQPDIQAFDTGGKSGGSIKPGAEDDLDLPDAADAVNREDAVQGDAGAAFLKCLAPGTLLDSFLQFEITRRKGPKPAPRLDRPAAQQHFAVVDDDGAYNNFGVLVGYVATLIAYGPRMRIAVGNPIGKASHSNRVLPGVSGIKSPAAS